MPDSPVLLIGGHGVTGRAVVHVLKSMHPDLALLIGGRDLEKAAACAQEFGATATRVDLSLPGLCLGEERPSAVIVLAKDAGLHAMEWARRLKIPYISLSSAAFEHSVDVTHALTGCLSAPVVIAGHWHAGAVMAATIDLASHFDSLDSVVAGIMIDRTDVGGGPASIADFERVARSSPTTLARIDGAYIWQSENESIGGYRGASGDSLQGKGAVSLDVVSIGAGTGAQNVRVLETWGTSHSFTSTGAAADEVSIEIRGRIQNRQMVGWRVLTLPRHVGSLTALSIALLLERVLGIGGDAPTPPGLYTPELLIPPKSWVLRLPEFGVQVNTSFTQS
jgi:hypothetical protein